jgi:hypothetical protein
MLHADFFSGFRPAVGNFFVGLLLSKIHVSRTTTAVGTIQTASGSSSSLWSMLATETATASLAASRPCTPAGVVVRMGRLSALAPFAAAVRWACGAVDRRWRPHAGLLRQRVCGRGAAGYAPLLLLCKASPLQLSVVAAASDYSAALMCRGAID